MKISGINGGICLMSGVARIRVEKKMIKKAFIEGTKGNYKIFFDAEWKGERLVLSSARNPYEPRVLKSLDGAISEVKRIGLQEALVRITTEDSP